MTTAFFEAADTSDFSPQSGTAGKSAEQPAVKRRRPRAANAGLKRAAYLQALAALIWVPQAALLARSVGAIADGKGLSAVMLPATLIFALGILRAGLDAAGARAAFRTARSELTRRRDIAVAALCARSPLDPDRPASGLAASLLAEQAETIVPYLARFLPARWKASIVPLVILACVLPISWVAAIILIVTAPLIPVFMALIGWRAQAASEQQLVATGGLNAFLLDRLRGLATIRALGAVDATAERLRADATSLRMRTMAVLKIAFLSSAVLELFAALGVAAVAVYIGFSLLGSITIGTWNGTLSLTGGLFILLLAPAFFEPLRELSAVWHDRAAGEAAIEALDDLSDKGLPLLGEEGEQRGGTIIAARSDGGASVRIDNLTFQHCSAAEPVVMALNLTIRAGEHVALLGPSGSGKTTLLSLIAGLAPADGGTIRIGTEQLDRTTADALRRRMVWIGQRPHIFAGTMIGNITLGRPGIDRSDALQAAHAMQLQHVLDAHGGSAIGEGGLGLSGGEALRLALARATVGGHIDLILADEPTAHLDAATANDIGEALLKLAKGRTLIVATHDPVLAAKMDRAVRIGHQNEEAAA